jgi:membrane protein insertase Oxa1/YidC/SpoIIIJ
MSTRTIAVESPRILEIKEKIKDEGYIQAAIQRLAQVLSNNLIEIKESGNERTY